MPAFGGIELMLVLKSQGNSWPVNMIYIVSVSLNGQLGLSLVFTHKFAGLAARLVFLLPLIEFPIVLEMGDP